MSSQETFLVWVPGGAYEDVRRVIADSPAAAAETFVRSFEHARKNYEIARGHDDMVVHVRGADARHHQAWSVSADLRPRYIARLHAFQPKEAEGGPVPARSDLLDAVEYLRSDLCTKDAEIELWEGREELSRVRRMTEERDELKALIGRLEKAAEKL